MTPGLQPSVHPVPNSYGVAIGWDGAGPLALKRNGTLALERTKPLILEQTGRLAIPEPSANGAA